MSKLKLVVIGVFVLCFASCVTNLNKEQFAIDFTGEEIPIMLNNFDTSQVAKPYTFTSGISSSTTSRTNTTSCGTTTTTRTTTDLEMSLKDQLTPLLLVAPRFIYVNEIKLYENYIIAFAGSIEKTELTISTNIGSK